MNGEGQDVVVITDTSVLVNFLCIDRMDLIARHSHRLQKVHRITIRHVKCAGLLHLPEHDEPPFSIFHDC